MDTGPASNTRVLIVDDDPAILSSINRLLHGCDCQLLMAKSATEALAVLRQQEIAVVIADYMMPNMNGMELLILVREKWPDTVGIMMTASDDVRVAAEAVNRQLVRYFVPKPWKSKEFVGLIRSAVRDYQQARISQTPSAETRAAAQEVGRLGNYRLVEHLATGGMADVYRASLLGADGFEKNLVVKKLLPHLSSDETCVRMFRDEALLMAGLNHGNIISVLDFGQIGGEYYLVMEYVDGITLRQLLDEPAACPNPLPVPLAGFIVQQVCQGLDYLHNKIDSTGSPMRIVHRDTKPANILVSLEGVVKIADFGIARSTGRIPDTQVGTIKGTLPYMSAEQLRGNPLDHRSDLFSLGVVLYELTTGRLPFSGSTADELLASINRGSYEPPWQVNPEVDRALSMVIKRALGKSPRTRFQTAMEMYAALSEYLRMIGIHYGPSDLSRLVRERITESRLMELSRQRMR
jgi:serine/threonine-protein kinase